MIIKDKYGVKIDMLFELLRELRGLLIRLLDVGVRIKLCRALRQLAIIMISSELPEVMGMSDRIVVMHEGIMTAILDRKDFSSELILKYATSEIPYQPAADEQ